MKLAVQDANIIIDLIKIDLWQITLQLELEIYTTDFVVGELDENQIAIIQPYIGEGYFRVRGFDAGEVVEIYDLNKGYQPSQRQIALFCIQPDLMELWSWPETGAYEMK